MTRRRLTLQAEPLRAGLAPGVPFPLLAVVAQRAAQRPGGRQPLRGQLERHFVEGGEMGGVTAAEGDLGHQARGAGQQGAHRCRFGVVGQLPMPVERAARLAQKAHALGHHHQRGRHRDDACGRERKRFARHVGRGQRQEAAQAVVEDEHRVLAVHLDATAPVVELAPQVLRMGELDQAALLHTAPERQQRRIEPGRAGEQQRDPTPGLRRVNQPRPVHGVPLCPGARAAVALHLQLHAGRRDVGERTEGVDRVQEGCFVTAQLGRETQLDRAALAQAGGDQHPLGQQPGSTIENGGCAAGPDIEPGRVDHQHRRPAAAQKRRQAR